MTTLALRLCALLLAFSSQAGAEGNATPAPQGVLEISSFSGKEEKRLACQRGITSAPCSLRLYQIMVEAFQDGDAHANYGTGYGTSHHRGDLQGIIDALDYIKALGVNSIWLTPIFETRRVKNQNEWTDRLDATGYFTTNYFAIDPKFGTDQQFQTLVSEVHKRDMYIFLDGVFGHYKENVQASPSGIKPVNREKCMGPSPDHDWFPDGGTRQACADYSSSDTRDFFNEVIGYWIQNYKIDGWRLDQAYQVPLEQWREFRATAERVAANTRYRNSRKREVHPLGYLVAEILVRSEPMYNSKAYGTTAEPALDSAFEFYLRDHLVATLATQESLENAVLPATWLNLGFEQMATYPDHAMPNLMLGNHDLLRFGDLIQRAGRPGPEHVSYWDRHKLALTFVAAFSGPITLYYGEETGQEVPGYAQRVYEGCASLGHCEDHVSRSSGRIAELSPQQEDLRAYVARLMALREKNPALSVGSRTHVYSDDAIYIDLKQAGKNRLLLLLNTREQDRTVTLASALLGKPGVLTNLIDNQKLKPDGNSFHIKLPALSARLISF